MLMDIVHSSTQVMMMYIPLRVSAAWGMFQHTCAFLRPSNTGTHVQTFILLWITNLICTYICLTDPMDYQVVTKHYTLFLHTVLNAYKLVKLTHNNSMCKSHSVLSTEYNSYSLVVVQTILQQHNEV